MENLIKAHQEAKQKLVSAESELSELKTRKKELEQKISSAGSLLSTANYSLSKALTAQELEESRAAVKTAEQYKEDGDLLVKNIERAIGVLDKAAPNLRNEIDLAEKKIWGTKCSQIIQEIKEQQGCIDLIKQAYVAYWESGMRWSLAEFINNEIIDTIFSGGNGINAQCEARESLRDEMVKQIWPEQAITIAQ